MVDMLPGDCDIPVKTGQATTRKALRRRMALANLPREQYNARCVIRELGKGSKNRPCLLRKSIMCMIDASFTKFRLGLNRFTGEVDLGEYRSGDVTNWRTETRLNTFQRSRAICALRSKTIRII